VTAARALASRSTRVVRESPEGKTSDLKVGGSNPSGRADFYTVYLASFRRLAQLMSQVTLGPPEAGRKQAKGFRERGAGKARPRLPKQLRAAGSHAGGPWFES